MANQYKIYSSQAPPFHLVFADIDAPERHQAFGTRSRQALSTMCFKKKAEVQILKLDRYRRTVGRVICDNKDTSAEQVKSGMAWVYDQYPLIAVSTNYKITPRQRSQVYGRIITRFHLGISGKIKRTRRHPHNRSNISELVLLDNSLLNGFLLID
ncbi:thermonuclease family protein [Legionella sp. 16cNR16C]|uniref:thermonuclease family protein n=1 Tax=Legionella sp. 16cNR16C TaxID=2905656 RepID=UPI00351CD9A7